MKALVESVKDTIVSTIKGTGEIVMRRPKREWFIATALKGTGTVGKALTDVIGVL